MTTIIHIPDWASPDWESKTDAVNRLVDGNPYRITQGLLWLRRTKFGDPALIRRADRDWLSHNVAMVELKGSPPWDLFSVGQTVYLIDVLPRPGSKDIMARVLPFTATVIALDTSTDYGAVVFVKRTDYFNELFSG